MPVELPTGVSITYAQQYRRCGRTACALCGTDGRGHGPYWYAFWREGGKARSRYLGKHAPSATDASSLQAEPAACAPTIPPSIPRLRVQTLGGFAVWRRERRIATASWATHRSAVLFKWLLNARGHRLSRDEALELLWPDADPGTSAANLRVVVYRLRKALADPEGVEPCLHYDGEALVLLPGSEGDSSPWLDADHFAQAARAALAGSDPAACRVALALYHGDYLPDDRYAEWAVQRREELRQLRLSLLLHLATLCTEAGDGEEAARCLRAVLAVDRCHEEAALALMRLYVAGGRPTQAIRIYRRLAEALRDDLDLEPEMEARTLARTLVAQRQAPAQQPAPAEKALPTNLPAPLTSFIGRREAVAELHRLLQPSTGDIAAPSAEDRAAPCRLVTLTGVGGCGKTRLAVQVADDLLDDRESFPDGIWLVELASVTDSALLPRAVAEVLGVQEEAARPLLITLAGALKRKQLLLVLDNCEHLLDTCAALTASLLAACPNLRILATSREALGVAGEQPWPVPALSLPAGDVPPSSLLQSEAARLFLDRARVRRPGLELHEGNVAAVAAICRQLDGLPLAIELAAARVEMLSVEQIAARLQRSLGLLVGGPRTALPRQQTLQATLDWSYGLLTGLEQAILRRLSVFAGGCTLDAAEAVCAGGEVSAGAVLDGLSGLVRKSLATVDDAPEHDQSHGMARYRLLETVRQYGYGKLVALGEEASARERHLAYYLAEAEEAEPRLRGPEQTTWLARLEREHDNLRAGLAWSMREGGDAPSGLQLAGALCRFWRVRGHLREGRACLEPALARGTAAAPRVRARALHGAGTLASSQGEYGQARALCEEALALHRELGDRWGIAASLSSLGNIAQEQGEYGRAEALCEEALILYHELQDTWGIANALHYLAIIAQEQGEYGQAQALCEEALALRRELGDKRNIANALYDLAIVVQGQGGAERARSLYEEALALQRELGDKRGITYSLNNLGAIAMAQGEYGQAQLLHDEALALQRELGDKRGIAYSLYNLGQLNAAQGQWAYAARLWGTANALGEAMGTSLPPHLLAVHERSLQPVRTALGDVGFAAAWAEGRAMPLEQAIACALEAATAEQHSPL